MKIRMLTAAGSVILSVVSCSNEQQSGQEQEQQQEQLGTEPQGPVETAASYQFGTAGELAEAVCDDGAYTAEEDGYDYSCQVNGTDVLITDWSTFGGAAGDDRPSQMVVDDTYTIQGRPGILDETRRRIDQEE